MNRDLVIFGPARKAKAPIQRTDDFIVAFRAAALRYAVVKGNTRFISDPGVTLNARPKTIARLHRLRMGGAEGAAAYCKICKDKQDLKVLGLPHNSGPAEIMAKADYVLKSVANSDLPVKGKVPKFVSLAEKRRNAVKKALAEGKFVATSSMSRLWFYPGAVTYRDRPGAIALDRADFVVRQQRQVVSADGRHRDGGRADRLTKEWTCEISKLYREIAAAVPESHFDAPAPANFCGHQVDGRSPYGGEGGARPFLAARPAQGETSEGRSRMGRCRTRRKGRTPRPPGQLRRHAHRAHAILRRGRVLAAQEHDAAARYRP